MKLTLGFSPCPNDTFVFNALVHGKLNTEGLEFDYFLADIEELNRNAFASRAEVIKISYHAYAYVAQDYLILDSGSAIGKKNGPLLVAKNEIEPEKINESRIAIPGKYTTANLLFSMAWPGALNKAEYLFSDIEDVVLRGDADAGLIIHETRFTYQKKGLVKIGDMGEYWENMTKLPIPLGVICIKRSVPHETALLVNTLIRQSLEYSYKDAMSAYDFVKDNAQEMDNEALNNHIKLYVNDLTLNLGEEGRNAVRSLLDTAAALKVIPEIPSNIFLT
jgi:1,4-dihydroxy-6-naphthoate synthase